MRITRFMLSLAVTALLALPAGAHFLGAPVASTTGTVIASGSEGITVQHGGFADTFAVTPSTAIRDDAGRRISPARLLGGTVTVTWTDAGAHVAGIIVLHAP